MYNPPVCPECGNLLTHVNEIVYEFYKFSPEYGTYHEEQMASELEVKCIHCDADVSALFPEGVCNYKTED